MPDSLETTTSSSIAALDRLGTQPARRKGLIVLGMHRSGTSALTRTLSLLGATLPAEILPPGPCNELGFWEPAHLPTLHEQLFAEAGSAWHDVSPFPSSWFRSDTALRFRDRLVDAVRREYGDAPLFVIKDPRICRLIPLWLSVLSAVDADPLFVISVRHPLEVAASLNARDGFSMAKSLLLWIDYLLSAEFHTRGHVRSLITYEALLNDHRSATEQIARELGLTLPRQTHRVRAEIEAFLSRHYRHHTASLADLAIRDDVADLIKRAYAVVISPDPLGTSRASIFDDLRAELQAADALFGPLVAQEVNSAARLRLDLDAAQEAAAARDAQLCASAERAERLASDVAQLHAALTELQAEAAAKADDIARLTGELANRDQEIQAALAERNEHLEHLAGARDEIDNLRRQLEIKEGSRAKLEFRIAALQKRMHRLDAGAEMPQWARSLSEVTAKFNQELAHLTHELQARDRLIEAIYNSTSWRVSAPVRALGRLLGRGR